jgi:hypothetical protein
MKENKWEEDIRNKFISKFTVWNDKYRYATLQGKEEYPTPDMIADWWICSIRETRQQAYEDGYDICVKDGEKQYKTSQNN